jgi:enamine deaminase RidA (YjgF/YER057c/UK114 family)
MTVTRIQPGKRMSQAVRHGATVYLAGQVATDYNASVTEQTKQVLDKIDALLAEAGTSKSNVLSVSVLLSNIADFAAMNSVYDTWIDPANPPARATYEARLADPSLRVEIIAIAAVPN